MKELFFISLFFFTKLVVSDYFEVATETCPLLKSPSAYFESFLFPCAVFLPVPLTMTCLTPQEEDLDLKLLPSWTLTKNSETGDSINRVFSFPDFQNAFLFMTQGAQLADKNQHHPDWRNLYNTVDITLTTVDKACLSNFDIAFAHGLDSLYSKFNASL
jgi:4a-hydroxytetrahydrobiopterin dehydratase